MTIPFTRYDADIKIHERELILECKTVTCTESTTSAVLLIKQVR